MKYSQSAINAMYGRALECVATELTELPANSEGALAAAGLQTQFGIIIEKSASKSGFAGTAKQGTAERSVARKNIRDYMDTLARSADSIARKKPGFDQNFPMSYGKNDNQLLADARAVAVKAVEHKEDFVGRGLTAAYLEAGAAFVADFENSLDTTNQAVVARGAAVGGKEAAYEAADDFFDTLDDFVRNFYRDQPAKLAAWRIASHIERSPKKPKEEPKP